MSLEHMKSPSTLFLQEEKGSFKLGKITHPGFEYIT